MTRHQREYLRRLPRHERLARLALIAKGHEIDADPFTDDRRIRAARADRLHQAFMAARQAVAA